LRLMIRYQVGCAAPWKKRPPRNTLAPVHIDRGNHGHVTHVVFMVEFQVVACIQGVKVLFSTSQATSELSRWRRNPGMKQPRAAHLFLKVVPNCSAR
jgi:hypothetical protein